MAVVIVTIILAWVINYLVHKSEPWAFKNSQAIIRRAEFTYRKLKAKITRNNQRLTSVDLIQKINSIAFLAGQ